MSALSDLRVGVVGAGVLGLCVAAELSRRGARVVVVDPASLGDNASGVSAGMLAPAFEAAFDEPARGRFGLLREARDLWPFFAEDHELEPPTRCGALRVGGDLAVAQAALAREGAAVEVLGAREAAEAAPGLTPGLDALFTPDDWRLEPAAALSALQAAVQARGGALAPAEALRVGAGELILAERSLQLDAVVVAGGFDSRRFAEAAPELALLEPVKGERLRFAQVEPRQGPIVRSDLGYVVPSAEGAVAGATMETGAADRRTTREAAAVLRAAASAMFPHLAQCEAQAAAGVRAGTPDGLPLVGRSSSGVLLATGARRNGWLFGPLAAQLIADLLAGVEPGPWAGRLHPGRF